MVLFYPIALCVLLVLWVDVAFALAAVGAKEWQLRNHCGGWRLGCAVPVRMHVKRNAVNRSVPVRAQMGEVRMWTVWKHPLVRWGLVVVLLFATGAFIVATT